MINCMTHGITNEPSCPECNGRKRILPNVDLPVFTPSWVSRSREMIAQNKSVLKELPPSTDADIILELEVGMDLLAQLLKAEGYKVNK